jgi:hypothetical protein
MHASADSLDVLIFSPKTAHITCGVGTSQAWMVKVMCSFQVRSVCVWPWAPVKLLWASVK